MLDFHLVAIHELSAEIAVYLMEIQAVIAGEEALGESYVSPHFFYVAGTAGIVSCGLDASAQSFVALETDYIVCLPAMEAYRGLL